jgi:hypothetical protein
MGKRLLLLAVFNLMCISLWAQTTPLRVVSGTLLSPEGDPLPGVSVRIKNTATGTVTNMEGWYSIEASLGDVLVYSFVGYAPYEVLVSQSNSTLKGGPASAQQKKKAELPLATKSLDALQQPGRERGVAVLSDSSARFELAGNERLYRNRISGPLAHIRYNRLKKTYVLVPAYYNSGYQPAFRLEFSTALSASSVNRLPALQQQYAQGRAVDGQLVYRGPGDDEFLSWGPALSSLGYDADGQLVPLQDALSPARAYDPYSLFRTAYAADNNVQLYGDINDYQLRLGYNNKFKNGILPNNNFDRHTVDLSLKREFYGIIPRLFFSYSTARENLPLRGANMASVLGSLYTSPPSFDLDGGLAGRRSWTNPASYQTADGSQRSFAPDQFDHPYWLINTLPDQQNSNKLLTGLDLMVHEYSDFSLQYNLTLDQEKTTDVWGLAPGSRGAPDGRLSLRQLGTTTLSSTLTPTLKPRLYSDSWALDLYAAYLFQYQQTTLERSDGFGFEGLNDYRLEDAELLISRDFAPMRRTHELVTKAKAYWSGTKAWSRFMQLSLSNRFYFSNTLADAAPYWFLPSASLNADLDKLDIFRRSNVMNKLSIWGAYASTVQEAPLIYNQWHFNSLGYQPSEFRGYFEDEELPLAGGLLPEKQQKYEAGTSLTAFSHRLHVNAGYYLTITDQLLAPVWNAANGNYQLQNVARIHTPGLELGLKTNGRFNNGFWEAGINLSRPRPVVKEIYLPENAVPLAGFSTISSRLIAGEPYGVLWGSRYLRHQDGQRIIGSDGFPLLAAEDGIIGNPNPNWLAGLNASSSWKSLSLLLAFDARKGGHIWNGTSQWLNYHGRSQLSAEQRLLQGYVFEGVQEGGGPNRQPVDFYDPARGMEENRWMRYGPEGIAEEAVEEVSWLRLQEVQLAYDLGPGLLRRLPIHKARLALTGKNLWMISTYQGIDPLSNLFGYTHASGLDLFNQPNVKTYGFSLTIQL